MKMDPRSPPEADVQQLISAIYKPSKPQLQAICSVNGLPKNGNKADLQARIIQLINDCARKQDSQRYHEVRQSVYNQIGQPAGMGSAPSHHGLNANQIPSHNSPQRYAPPSYSSTTPYGLSNGQRGLNPATMLQQSTLGRSVSNGRTSGLITPGFQFKPSPFYEMRERLGEMKICEVMTQHRNSVSLSVKASEVAACLTDSSMRVMVFCAGGNTGIQDITFPHQSELKVNGGEVKANLRGLKNKPGSTRPVDITQSLRLKPSNYSNAVDFTYALTTTKFYVVMVLCKVFSVEKLVDRIEKKIRKDTVISELTKKAHDPDIEATSLNLSLKCPLSYMRLKCPCRGLSCSHIQCFDATSYLQLQEQGPQWICPICNKAAPFDQLAVDEYVREILSSTPDSVEQVTIDPFGKWSVPGAKKEVKPQEAVTAFIDDDLVIASPSVPFHRKGSATTTSTPARGSAGPLSSLVGASTTPSQNSAASGRASSKRPAEVIDLTLSDDEDDYRPAKRVNFGHSGFHGGSY